jgi:hypothetical protein
MTPTSRIKWVSFVPCGTVIALGLAFAGCDREGIKVQELPKEAQPMIQAAPPVASAPAMSADPHAGMAMGMSEPTAQPQLKWTLPSGWKEKPASQMRAASFDADGADVSVIPLPSGGPQMELGVLNMWHSELQLEPAEKADSEPVPIGSAQGKLFEISGGKTPGRILAAVIDHDGTSWYFKMKGEDAVVTGQKAEFLEFLKSVSFESTPATAAADPHAGMHIEPAATPPAAPAESTTASSGSLPAGWKEVPPTQFLVAKYVIQGSGDAKAEVNVSMLAGTGGGVMANVTRWRGQLGLPPLTEEDWSKQARTIDLASGKGTVVDMTGTDAKTGKKARLIGIIAPGLSETWFYKLMGDEQIVEQQKDIFTKFIQTAKFAN